MIFPCTLSRLRICSRETGSAVPSPIRLLISTPQAKSGAYLRGSSRFPRRRPFIIYFNRYTPSGQCRVYRVTHLSTYSVHCRESTGTGSVVLQLVPVTGAALAGFLTSFFCRCPSAYYVCICCAFPSRYKNIPVPTTIRSISSTVFTGASSATLELVCRFFCLIA